MKVKYCVCRWRSVFSTVTNTWAPSSPLRATWAASTATWRHASPCCSHTTRQTTSRTKRTSLKGKPVFSKKWNGQNQKTKQNESFSKLLILLGYASFSKVFQKKIEKLFDPGFENHDSPGNAATLYRLERSPVRAFEHIEHLNILCKWVK